MRSAGMDYRKVHAMPEGSHRRTMHDVRAPSPMEGVGNALRNAYAEPSSALPAEFTRLLDRLR